MLRRCILCMVLLLIVVPVTAQPESEWQLVRVQSLRDLIGGGYAFHNAILSPDGSKIGWDEGGVCIYFLATDEVQCTPMEGYARDLRTNRYNLPVWSLDSTQIAYTENLFIFFNDSDIWLFDVESQTFTNRTDDGFNGSLLQNGEWTDVPADYLPTWNPATGELYFFRSMRREPATDDEPDFSTGLYRFGENGEPELVRDLTFDVPVLSIYKGVTFSPDGKRLTLAVLPPDALRNPVSGVWLLDLEQDTLEQVVSVDDLNAVLPDWGQRPLLPDTVEWTQDGLAVSLQSNVEFSGLMREVVYVEPETGAVEPVIDFRAFESPADLINARVDGPSSASDSPFAGAVSPDGSEYWYIGFTVDPREATIYQAGLPPTDEPVELESIDLEVLRANEPLATVSRDGKALLYNFLLTFEQP